MAPDESFLLFSSDGHGDRVGESDLYLSVRDQDGGWSAPRVMGPAGAGQACLVCFWGAGKAKMSSVQ